MFEEEIVARLLEKEEMRGLSCCVLSEVVHIIDELLQEAKDNANVLNS